MNTPFPRTPRIRSGLFALSCLAATPLALAGPLPSIDPGPKGGPKGGPKAVPVEFAPPTECRWTLSAGAIWRQLGDVRFNTGTSPSGITPFFGGNSYTPPPGIGPDSAYADRTYDDGFVNIDEATLGDGMTGFFGYNNASQLQFDAMENASLVYTRTGGERRMVSAISTTAPVGWMEDADTEVGPYLELCFACPVADNLTVGGGLNFSFISIDPSRNGLNTFSQSHFVDIYDVTATDTYPVTPGGEFGMPTPAPYTGTYNRSGRALIPNIPPSRVLTETPAGSQVANFYDVVGEGLDLDFYTIGLGGQVAWLPHPSCFLRAEGGVAINLADWDAHRNEQILVAVDRGPYTPYSSRMLNSSDNDVLFGLYLQAALGWQINDNWSLQVFGRYDWNESLDGTVGPSTFSVDLDGWSAGIAAGYRF